jgi:hypothetical protein
MRNEEIGCERKCAMKEQKIYSEDISCVSYPSFWDKEEDNKKAVLTKEATSIDSITFLKYWYRCCCC